MPAPRHAHTDACPHRPTRTRAALVLVRGRSRCSPRSRVWRTCSTSHRHSSKPSRSSSLRSQRRRYADDPAPPRPPPRAIWFICVCGLHTISLPATLQQEPLPGAAVASACTRTREQDGCVRLHAAWFVPSMREPSVSRAMLGAALGKAIDVPVRRFAGCIACSWSMAI